MPLALPGRRAANALGFFACAAMLGYAYYEQFVNALDPCPLCIFQRLAVIVLGAVFLAAALHHPARLGARLYALLIGLVSAGGMAIAAWHVHIQNLPPGEVPACGPGLDYMLEVLPLAEAIRQAFTGSGECAVVDWSFLGLSMPAWVFITLAALGTFGVLKNWRVT